MKGTSSVSHLTKPHAESHVAKLRLKGSFLAKIHNIQIKLSQRVFVQNSSELVRLKALDAYFAFFEFANMYEHFPSMYEHFKLWV